MISKSLGIAAGAAAVGFIGYCVYFDHKRRSDPDFKKKLRERRQKQRESKDAPDSRIPDLSNPSIKQQFFFQEMQLGEEKLAEGHVMDGVEHLALSVAVCEDSERLLAMLSQTFPHQVAALVRESLPAAREKIRRSQRSAPTRPAPEMVEMDLE